MRRKLDVTASDMLALREQGLSNHDIAASLDISIATVRRYIGKQGGHMEGLAAFKDSPPHRKTEDKGVEMPVLAKYEPKPVTEIYAAGESRLELNNEDRILTISSDAGEIMFSYSDIPDLVQFLAWAMRTRMDEDS